MRWKPISASKVKLPNNLALMQIGNSSVYTLVEKKKGFGVYAKRCGRHLSWIIAKIPPMGYASDNYPTSVLEDFDTAEAAVSALRAWAIEPEVNTSTEIQEDMFAGIKFEPNPKATKKRRR
jgi:hypothetical protein